LLKVTTSFITSVRRHETTRAPPDRISWISWWLIRAPCNTVCKKTNKCSRK
jgi:hypothetical protein